MHLFNSPLPVSRCRRPASSYTWLQVCFGSDGSGSFCLGSYGIEATPCCRPSGDVASRKRLTRVPGSLAAGDHPSTASAIAQQVGILPKGRVPFGLVMHASDFDRLSDKEIDGLRQLPRVLARCAPETKVRLIRALHRRNRRCAMTGDGEGQLSLSASLAELS